MPIDEAVVAVRGVTRCYGVGAARAEALRGVDLTVAPGEHLALAGASGSGKSTLLHLIAGLDRPTTGTVRVAGHDLAALDDEGRTLLRRRRIGLVFQSFNLVETLTAEENVALPLALDGARPAAARARAAGALERVGLAARRRHRPGELSGGEQQRVAVARALVIEPALLLADEPTGNLDSAAAAGVLDLLFGATADGRRALLLVTHDPAQAARADRRVLLRDGLAVAA
jgi:putative ABC transport system ATP-binding protein